MKVCLNLPYSIHKLPYEKLKSVNIWFQHMCDNRLDIGIIQTNYNYKIFQLFLPGTVYAIYNGQVEYIGKFPLGKDRYSFYFPWKYDDCYIPFRLVDKHGEIIASKTIKINTNL